MIRRCNKIISTIIAQVKKQIVVSFICDTVRALFEKKQRAIMTVTNGKIIILTPHIKVFKVLVSLKPSTYSATMCIRIFCLPNFFNHLEFSRLLQFVFLLKSRIDQYNSDSLYLHNLDI